jgi:hypothetical protein
VAVEVAAATVHLTDDWHRSSAEGAGLAGRLGPAGGFSVGSELRGLAFERWAAEAGTGLPGTVAEVDELALHSCADSLATLLTFSGRCSDALAGRFPPAPASQRPAIPAPGIEPSVRRGIEAAMANEGAVERTHTTGVFADQQVGGCTSRSPACKCAS